MRQRHLAQLGGIAGFSRPVRKGRPHAVDRVAARAVVASGFAEAAALHADPFFEKSIRSYQDAEQIRGVFWVDAAIPPDGEQRPAL